MNLIFVFVSNIPVTAISFRNINYETNISAVNADGIKVIVGNNKSNFLTVNEILKEPQLNALYNDEPSSFFVRSYAVTFILDDTIIVFEKIHPSGGIDTIEMYDPDSDSFFIVTKINNNEVRTNKINGNEFPEDLIKLIADLKPDNKIIFSDISITCPDCNIRKASSVEILIKESLSNNLMENNSDIHQENKKELSIILNGKWNVVLSTFPMWKKGNKLNPTFNYNPINNEKWNDIVQYQTKNGNTKMIKGKDKLITNNPPQFLWRGTCLLSFVTSRWQIDYIADDASLMIISFQKTLFTPAGIDVLSRKENLEPSELQIITKLVHTLYIDNHHLYKLVNDLVLLP